MLSFLDLFFFVGHVFTFDHGKLPLNHGFGRKCLELVPSILSKSRVCCVSGKILGLHSQILVVAFGVNVSKYSKWFSLTLRGRRSVPTPNHFHRQKIAKWAVTKTLPGDSFSEYFLGVSAFQLFQWFPASCSKSQRPASSKRAEKFNSTTFLDLREFDGFCGSFAAFCGSFAGNFQRFC